MIGRKLEQKCLWRCLASAASPDQAGDPGIAVAVEGNAIGSRPASEPQVAKIHLLAAVGRELPHKGRRGVARRVKGAGNPDIALAVAVNVEGRVTSGNTGIRAVGQRSIRVEPGKKGIQP